MDISSLIDITLNNMQARAPDVWKWGPNKQGAFWIVYYTGFQPPCKFYVEVGQHFIYLHAPLEINIWPECRLAVYRYALRLNEEMSGAKLCLSPGGLLSLNVEWPHENLTPLAFETAIQVLLSYFKLYYADIQLVAQDVDLAGYLAAHEIQAQAEAEAASQEFQIEVLQGE